MWHNRVDQCVCGVPLLLLLESYTYIPLVITSQSLQMIDMLACDALSSLAPISARAHKNGVSHTLARYLSTLILH